MGCEHRILGWLALLLAASLLVGGCVAPQPTVPTAVLYDRDRDEFSVEVESVPEGQEPVYPDELEFVTLIDGERHEGLIPTPSAYVEDPERILNYWMGPEWVEFEDSRWRLRKILMTLPHTEYPDQPVPVHARTRSGGSHGYPTYFFKIKGAKKRLLR